MMGLTEVIRFFLDSLLDYLIKFEVFYFYNEQESPNLAIKNTETVGVALILLADDATAMQHG
jgi:hypothetical protein